MKLSLLKNKISCGKFDNIFQELYSDINVARDRYLVACNKFYETFGERDVSLFSVPGRTEVCGNHTDHQNGCVLAASVDLDIIAVVSKNSQNIVNLLSEGFDIDTVDLNILTPQTDEFSTSAALIRGVSAALAKSGYSIGGFDAYTTSNVPSGAGLSSSAAFEVMVGAIQNHFFNSGVVKAEDIAKFSQYAECDFFGKPCGLMDQTACSVGGFTAIDFKYPKEPVIEKVDFDFSAHNHTLCIVNIGVSHADLTDDYADIMSECRAVAKCFDKTVLREVNEEDFYKSVSNVRNKTGDRAVLRAMHFFAENSRAVKAKEVLLNNDFLEFLSIIKESGNSSYKYLQNVYSNSNVHSQGISLALAITEKYLGDRGAFRVHGGGFAGTIAAFVPNELLNGYIQEVESVFGKKSCYTLNIRNKGAHKII